MLEHGLLNHENDILANENTNKEMIKNSILDWKNLKNSTAKSHRNDLIRQMKASGHVQ